MSEDNNQEKKRGGGGRIYRKAGMHLPSHNLRSTIKSRVGKRRVQKHVDVAVGAQAEYLVAQLLRHAAKSVGEHKYIEAADLHKALNDQSSPVFNVFPKGVGGIY